MKPNTLVMLTLKHERRWALVRKVSPKGHATLVSVSDNGTVNTHVDVPCLDQATSNVAPFYVPVAGPKAGL